MCYGQQHNEMTEEKNKTNRNSFEKVSQLKGNGFWHIIVGFKIIQKYINYFYPCRFEIGLHGRHDANKSIRLCKSNQIFVPMTHILWEFKSILITKKNINRIA